MLTQPQSRKLRWAAILVLAALGLAVTRQYGESWDERQFFKYADRALQSYGTWPRTGSVPLTGNTYDNYGPAYVMLAALGARLLASILPWSISDLRHLFYFFTFLLGMWAFYRLCARWLSLRASLGATLLLATQPLIWGHAFISPKDIPFLSFFLLTLVLGLEMVDSVSDAADVQVPMVLSRRLRLLTGACVTVLLALFLATPLVHASITALVQAAAAGQTNVIARFASDVRTVDPAVYIEKYFVWFLRGRAALVGVLALVVAYLWRTVPDAVRRLGRVAPAAFLLGFSTSIRILGPLPALMVAIYAVRRLGRRALPLLVLYISIALAVMYATWPYLWPDPVGHLVESVLVMSRYPWRGQVLFSGHFYASTDLPASYLPVLLAIQITEPAWLLILGGAAAGLWTSIHKDRASLAILMLGLVWCVLPLAGLILSRSPLYDNSRQVIFILPPLFMLAGLAFQKVRDSRVQLAVMALAILPGVVDGVRLHPYQYIYYNRLVGGVQGAFRRYELDYWGISFREAADYLSAIAAPGSSIWVEGPTHLFQAYARPDLRVYSTYEKERLEHYDYVVALTRYDMDLASYPEAPVVHVIERDDAALTVIKKPQW